MSFIMIFPYTSCLARSQLVSSLTKNTASGNQQYLQDHSTFSRSTKPNFLSFLTFPLSSYFILLANPIFTFNIFRSIVNFHLLFFSLFLFLHSNISFLYSTNKISQILQDLSQSIHLSITLRCVVSLYDFTLAPICFDRGIWYDKLSNCFHL
jgi:hypothetical protein